MRVQCFGRYANRLVVGRYLNLKYSIVCVASIMHIGVNISERKSGTERTEKREFGIFPTARVRNWYCSTSSSRYTDFAWHTITRDILTRPGQANTVVYPELVSGFFFKSRKFKWLVKVGASKDVTPIIKKIMARGVSGQPKKNLDTPQTHNILQTDRPYMARSNCRA